jgi:predicted phage tail protein
MAHSLAYKISSPGFIGAQPIDVTSTTQQHPLGTVIRAVDATYGEGEFIYLKGVASTTASAAVVYNAAAGTTTLTTATTAGAVAIAMSANVASQYGWYQISGEAVVLVAASVVAAKNVAGLAATPGTLTPGVTGAANILSAIAKTATDTPTTGYAQIQIQRPYMQPITLTIP